VVRGVSVGRPHEDDQAFELIFPGIVAKRVIEVALWAVANADIGFLPAGPAEMTMAAGGSLSTPDFYIGWAQPGCELHMTGGRLDVTTQMSVGGSGSGSTGLVDMTGGVVDVGVLFIDNASGSVFGQVDLAGGTIIAGNLSVGANGMLDITGGTFIWENIDLPVTGMSSWNNWIYAYGGAGTLVATRDGTNTTITALKPLVATNPDPNDEQTGVERTPTLSWEPGAFAATVDGHEVYFDLDEQKVIDRTGCDVNGFSTTDPCYPIAGPLDLGKTYYWAVDEVNGVDSWEGDVWSFTVIDHLVVDDMESYVPYTTPGNEMFAVWVDDCGRGAAFGDGSVVSVEIEETIAADGNSMRFDFNDTVAGLDYLSKATAEVANLPIFAEIGKDWTAWGVRTLTFSFRGVEGNGLEPMWIELGDTGTGRTRVLYPDLNDVNDEAWHEWNIDLQDFNTGGTPVNLSSVNDITIGFGDGTLGGGGSPPLTFPSAPDPYTVYFDDIRVYPSVCVLAKRDPCFARVDYVQDCVVDYKEVEVMAENWLAGGPIGFRNYMPRGFQAGTAADLEVPFATTAPVIDGVLNPNEWDNAMALEVVWPDIDTSPKDAEVWYGVAPASADDFSATWYMKWDASNLYVAVSVYDSTPAFIDSSGWYNDQDCMQIELDLTQTQPAIMNGTSAIYDFTAETFDGIGATVARHYGGAKSGNFTAPELAAISAASTLVTDGYIIEAALPWSVLDHTGLGYTPSVGDTHGVGILNVDFNSVGLLTLLSMFPDMWNTSSWKTLTLVNVSTQHSSLAWNTGIQIYPIIQADLEPDGIVDIAELAVLAEHWLEGVAP